MILSGVFCPLQPPPFCKRDFPAPKKLTQDAQWELNCGMYACMSTALVIQEPPPAYDSLPLDPLARGSVQRWRPHWTFDRPLDSGFHSLSKPSFAKALSSILIRPLAHIVAIQETTYLASTSGSLLQLICPGALNALRENFQVLAQHIVGAVWEWSCDSLTADFPGAKNTPHFRMS
jgi:hypothetical protein